MTKRQKGPTPARRSWQPMTLRRAYDSPMLGRIEIWGNDRYTVTRRFWPMVEEMGGTVEQLGIHSHTRGTVGAHDWRHFQIFPAESQLVDTSNEYHLWVLPEGMDVPFGFKGERVVRDVDEPPISSMEELREASRQLGIDPDGMAVGIRRPKQRRMS